MLELLLFLVDVVNYSLELIVKAVEILPVFLADLICSNLLIEPPRNILDVRVPLLRLFREKCGILILVSRL